MPLLVYKHAITYILSSSVYEMSIFSLIFLLRVSCFEYAEPVFINVYGAQESIPLAYVAGRACTTNRVVAPARQVEN